MDSTRDVTETELRAKAEAKEKRIEELERKIAAIHAEREAFAQQATEERAKREAAEQQAAEERAQREAVEQRKAAEQREKEERAKREGPEQSLEALMESLLIKATDYLQTPLPPYGELEPSTSCTHQKLAWKRPTSVVPWSDFEDQFSPLMASLGESKVRKADELADSTAIKPSKVPYLYAFVNPCLLRITRVLAESCSLYSDLLNRCIWGEMQEDRGGGNCDITFLVNSVLMLIIELKRPSTSIAIIDPSAVMTARSGETYPVVLHQPHALYDLSFSQPPKLNGETGSANAKNLAWLILQTYNYLLTHGNQKYGVATNYEWWVFLKRTVVNSDEVLEVSKFYHRVSARLPLASSIVASFFDNIRTLPHGRFSDSQLSVDIHDDMKEMIPLHKHEQPPGTGDVDKGHLHMTDSEEEQERKDLSDYFTVGREVSGFRFTTTMDALGIDSLSVDAESPVLLSRSEKSAALRVQVGGRDLVYRQIDVYKLPKRNSDFPLEVIAMVVQQELEAYRLLRPVWGILVPEFVYFGHDFAMLWVFVTCYAGVSLTAIARECGGLSQAIKNGARESLIQIHAFGVLHGDVAPRNAVYRASDKRVLWVDFEFSKVVPSGQALNNRARLELETLDAELAMIPTIADDEGDTDGDKPATTISSQADATPATSQPKKKSKVVAEL